MAQDFGDWWVENNISAPIVWLFSEVAADPSVVASYEVNMLYMGPVRYHEWTVPVYK